MSSLACKMRKFSVEMGNPDMEPFLSVIIPAFNEAKRITLTLIAINDYLSKVEYSYEVIVVDNNSTDSTLQEVKQFLHPIKNLRLVECQVQGKGAAVKKGMLDARGQIRLFTDADNSTPIEQFSKMIPYFREGYQIVIGSRAIEGAKLNPPQAWHRRSAGNLGNLFIRVLLLPGIRDTQCGFKAFTKEAAEKIFPLIRTKKFGFDIEVLALAKKFDYKIKEIPVVWVNKPFSHVKVLDYLQVLRDTFKVKLWLETNRYNLD